LFLDDLFSDRKFDGLPTMFAALPAPSVRAGNAV